ncbi:MAG: VacJ family lipoprotein [Planctomycetes bacterium]|nr:VacJ family lipoprotein [Planctomycetota bacterium]
MKLQSWAIVILVVMTAGCAVSEKSPSGNTFAEVSANGRHDLIDSTETFTDDEFDLLEEELDEQIVEIDDPLEPFNRLMFGLNDTLYFLVFKPVAQTYKAVAPEPARIGVRNFFQNIGTPVRYVNCLLQGKGQSADIELRRFLVNTTVGVLGFGDPARDQYGLEPTWEDLGQTLAVHGMDSGFYIVWPFLGPSTVRDSLGMVGDMFLNPVRYVEPWETSYIISATRVINGSSFHIEEYEEFKAEFLEPYVAMREAYVQYRDESIKK